MDWFAFLQLILAAALVWQAITYDLRLPNWWPILLFALAVVIFGFAFV